MRNVEEWPPITAEMRQDGAVEVAVAGITYVIDSPSQALALAHQTASELERPVRIVASSDGVATDHLIVNPDATYFDEHSPEQVWPINVRAGTDDTSGSPQGSASGHGTFHSAAESTVIDALDPATPAEQVVETMEQPLSEPPVVSEPTEAVELGSQVGQRRKPEPLRLDFSRDRLPERQADQVAAAKRGGSHRRSFLKESPTPLVAKQGWRGTLNRWGFHLPAGPVERQERAAIRLVAQHFPGLRTVAVANPKGSSNKTPTVAMLSAVFARHGGAGVLAWDNNETRGSLAWRTQSGPHESTVLDLLPKSEVLLSTVAQSAEMSRFTHHQAEDKYDVLRSDQSLEGDHEISADDVDTIHRVAARFYRMILMDSGNNDRASNWRAMIERTNMLVVPITDCEDTAEAGARMLEALNRRDDHSKELAQNSIAVLSQRSPGTDSTVRHIAQGFESLVREVIVIPYDPAMESGVIHYDALRPATQRAWLAATAAVAHRL